MIGPLAAAPHRRSRPSLGRASDWTLDDIRQILSSQAREGQRLAFTAVAPVPGHPAIAKTIAAMANGGGGTIVFGIEQDVRGRAVGPAEPPLRELHDAADAVVKTARFQIDEPIDVVPTAVCDETGDGPGFLVVDVPESDRVPHFVRGIAWGRSGRRILRLRRADIAARFARSRGFLQETGLSAELLHPARIIADVQRVGSARILTFRNIGERAARSVAWRIVSGGEPRLEPSGTRGVDALAPSATHAIYGLFPLDSMPAKLEITWVDEVGAPDATIVVIT